MYKTKNFKVSELYVIQNEISLLLREKLRAVLRVDTTELLDQISVILKPIDTIRQELYAKYLKAEVDGGKKPTECTEYPQFEKEVIEVLEMEREIKYIPIKRSYLEFDTDKDYRLIFRLVEKEAHNMELS